MLGRCRCRLAIFLPREGTVRRLGSAIHIVNELEGKAVAAQVHYLNIHGFPTCFVTDANYASIFACHLCHPFFTPADQQFSSFSHGGPSLRHAIRKQRSYYTGDGVPGTAIPDGPGGPGMPERSPPVCFPASATVCEAFRLTRATSCLDIASLKSRFVKRTETRRVAFISAAIDPIFRTHPVIRSPLKRPAPPLPAACPRSPPAA